MAQNFFNARLLRMFVDVGLARPAGNEEMFFNGQNTKIQDPYINELNIGFTRNNLNVRGSRRTKFNKLEIRKLFRNITPVVWMYTPRSTGEVAQALIERYGLPLQKEWFANTAIPPEVGNNPPFKVKLALIGTDFTYHTAEVDLLEVEVRQSDVDIGTLFESNVLDAPSLPFVVRQGYINTELMTYSKDFTPETIEVYKLLAGINTSAQLFSSDGTNDETSLMITALLHSRLGVPVVREGDVEGALTLRDATLVYNGLTSGFAKADSWYDRVLVFDTVLDPTSSTARTYRGRCYVHYNELS